VNHAEILGYLFGSRILPWQRTWPTQSLRDLKEAFDIPTQTFSYQYQVSTGFLYADEKHGTDDALYSFSTAFRFLVKSVAKYKPISTESSGPLPFMWTEIGFWTQWRPNHSDILLCSVLDLRKTTLLYKLRQALTNDSLQVPLSSALGWHGILLPFVSCDFDEAVWDIRDFVRAWESNRPQVCNVSRLDYVGMHEIARHVLHSTETLGMAIAVVDQILAEVHTSEILQTRASIGICQNARKERNLVRALYCEKMLLQSTHKRSQALEGRLRNEIALVSIIYGYSFPHIELSAN
jgi:hypothetical protein